MNVKGGWVQFCKKGRYFSPVSHFSGLVCNGHDMKASSWADLQPEVQALKFVGCESMKKKKGLKKMVSGNRGFVIDLALTLLHETYLRVGVFRVCIGAVFLTVLCKRACGRVALVHRLLLWSIRVCRRGRGAFELRCSQAQPQQAAHQHTAAK